MKRKDFLSELTGVKSDKPKPSVEKFQNIKLPDHLDFGPASINPFSGTWGRAQVKHLLNRTLFGHNLADEEFFMAMTMDQAVDYIMNVPSTQPSPPINVYSTEDPDVPYEQTWVGADEGNNSFLRIASTMHWWMTQMAKPDRHIREKMTMFFHNHFATQIGVVELSNAVYYHHAFLRENSLGNFKQMVKDITIDAAMLKYLNGYLNTSAAPDENYARELMELFTLGKAPESQYTESDIKAAAKVLTGWSLNFLDNFKTKFYSDRHDTTNKTFSSFFNNTTITGKTGANGATETNELIDMIFTKEDVIARHLVRKLYRYFVYYTINTNIENSVIIPLANQFKTDWDIKKVVTALLKSEHFFSSVFYGCQIKNPVDNILKLFKQFNLQIPTNNLHQYNLMYFFTVFTNITSMEIGNPPSVAGWPAYYQTPQYQQLWLSSDTLPKRIQVVVYTALAGFSFTQDGTRIQADLIEFAKQFNNPSNPNELIQNSIDILYSFDLGSTIKAELKKDTLLFGQTQDHYWTDVWNDYINNPNDTAKADAVKVRLFLMLKYLLDRAEYQLA